MAIKALIHTDIVWVIDIASGWYFTLKPLPEAVKTIKVKVKGKEEKKVVPDLDHPIVKDFIKKNRRLNDPETARSSY